MDIKKILADHLLYLQNDPKGVCADLTGANLTDANLRHADLTGANLTDANLTDANLRHANLRRANLTGANLTGANLTDADLSYANLTGGGGGANLTNANLSYANLTDANLGGADLRDATLPAFQIPQEGTLIVWKKVVGGYLLKLEVTGKRTASLVGRKCRASEVKVLGAYKKGKRVWRKKFTSIHNGHFFYEVDKVIKVSDYDPNPAVECTKGIHFFLTREEAENYAF